MQENTCSRERERERERKIEKGDCSLPLVAVAINNTAAANVDVFQLGPGGTIIPSNKRVFHLGAPAAVQQRCVCRHHDASSLGVVHSSVERAMPSSKWSARFLDHQHRDGRGRILLTISIDGRGRILLAHFERTLERHRYLTTTTTATITTTTTTTTTTTITINVLQSNECRLGMCVRVGLLVGLLALV